MPLYPSNAPYQVPRWLLLLSGLGFGSVFALLWAWLRRRLLAAAGVAVGFGAASQGALGGMLHATPPPVPAASLAHPAVTTGLEAMPPAQLTKMTEELRKHVGETREATASLRRTMEQNHRQFQSSALELQRKFLEATRRKNNAGAQRMEISAESLQMLRALVSPQGASDKQDALGKATNAEP